jgi:hypothetical protein
MDMISTPWAKAGDIFSPTTGGMASTPIIIGTFGP